MALAQETVDHVQRLLIAGIGGEPLSHRKIARMMGVSRSTVNLIASGQRRLKMPREPDLIQDAASGPVRRCPVHGTLVRMPCLACKIEALSRRYRRPNPERGDSMIRLELHGGERLRYEQVRRRAMGRGELGPGEEDAG